MIMATEVSQKKNNPGSQTPQCLQSSINAEIQCSPTKMQHIFSSVQSIHFIQLSFILIYRGDSKNFDSPILSELCFFLLTCRAPMFNEKNWMNCFNSNLKAKYIISIRNKRTLQDKNTSSSFLRIGIFLKSTVVFRTKRNGSSEKIVKKIEKDNKYRISHVKQTKYFKIAF